MAVCCGWKLGGSEAERGRLFPEREQGEGRGQTSRTPGPAHPGKEHRARRQKGGRGVSGEKSLGVLGAGGNGGWQGGRSGV